MHVELYLVQIQLASPRPSPNPKPQIPKIQIQKVKGELDSGLSLKSLDIGSTTAPTP